MKAFGLMAAALALVAGCSKDNGNSNTDAACPPGMTCTVSTKAIPTYYQQFVYKADGDCTSSPDALRFQWLGLIGRTVVAKNPDGTEVAAELNLYLAADGTYTGEYQENVQKLADPGFWQDVSVQNKKDLKGTWTTSELNITLSDLGSGQAAVIANLPGAIVTVAGKTLNASLDGQKLPLAPIRSKVSKDLQTVAQFCGGAH